MKDNIILPNGEVKNYKELLEDLKNEDNIRIVEVPKDVDRKLSKFYDYDLKKKITYARFKTYEELNKYLQIRLKDFINGPEANDFIEKNLPGVKESTEAIKKTIDKGGKIMIVSDMDADGVTSGAILYKMFKRILDYDNIDVMVNKKKFGHGINATLTNLLIQSYHKEPYDLIITSDHGSHNRDNITKLKEELGVDIIVTDHHLFKEDEKPIGIEAFVNPKIAAPETTDFYHITGATVAYFTLVHYFNKYGQTDDYSKIEYLYYLITYLGLTVISDCVDLKSFVNRKILIKALSTINNIRIQHDPFWKLMLELQSKVYLIDENVLGFSIIPEINSPGRIDDPINSFKLLAAETLEEAKEAYEYVHNVNTSRKKMQKNVLKEEDRVEYSDGVIKVVLIDNSEGIQGILANNILINENYKMVVVFTKHMVNDEVIYIGSGRSQEGTININQILEEIKNNEDIIINFGGHENAVGVKIKPDLKKFFKVLKKYIAKYKIKQQKEIVAEDYIFSFRKLLLDIFASIELSPFGKGFEKPTFVSDFRIAGYKFIRSKSGNFLTMKVSFIKSRNVVNVFYNIKDSEYDKLQNELKYNRYVRMVYSFNLNTFRNFNKIQLLPKYMRFYEA